MPIDPLPSPPPTRQDPENFAARGDAFMAALPPFALQAEAARQEIVAAEASVAAAAPAAIAAANYRGEYNPETLYSVGESVSHSGDRWAAKQPTQGNAPTDGSAYWLRIIAIPGMAGQSGKFLTTNGSQPAWADVQTIPIGGIGWFARDDLTFEWRGMKFVRSGAAVTSDLAPSWPQAVTDLLPLFQSAQLTTINNGVDQIEADRSGTWVAIDTSGNFRRSTDGGTTWSSGTTGAGAPGLATDRSGVWISAGNNNFRRSTNGGSSWSAISHSSGNLRCIATDRSGVWVAAGNSGAALRSTDNGATWSSVTSGFGSSAIHGVATDCNGNWLMVGNSGKISRSTDNGATWTALTAVGSSIIESVATDESGVWVIGSSKTYRSINIGTNWTEVFPGPSINGIRHVTGSKWVGHGYLSAVGGYAIFFSSDAGVTWSYQLSMTALATLYAVATDGSKYLIAASTGSASPYTYAVRSVELDLVGIAEYTRHKYLRYD